jgi:uncharacterized repeat protein (TIGR01451 family)
LTKTADADTVDAGSHIGFTITASNSNGAGTGTAHGVVIDDPLPSGTGIDWSIASGPANCAIQTSSGSETLHCTAVDLAPGASESVHVTSATGPSSAKAYANTATLTAANHPTLTADATTTVEGSPALTLTKTADPTTYSYPGQVIVYSYTLTNTGNVTLSGPYTITDDTLGSIACGTGSLAPTESTSCSVNYTIVAADLNTTNDASITNHATGAGTFGTDTVTSNQAEATIHQVAPTALIKTDGTSCKQFRDGAGRDLTDEAYSLKKGKIDRVSPDRFTYFSKITAPAPSFSISVGQSNNLSWKPMGIEQVTVYDATCKKTTLKGTTSNGTVTIIATGATTGATYYVGVDYLPRDLHGQAVPSAKPTDVYTFLTSINGSVLITSQDSVNVRPK